MLLAGQQFKDLDTRLEEKKLKQRDCVVYLDVAVLRRLRRGDGEYKQVRMRERRWKG